MQLNELVPGNRARLISFGDTPMQYRRRLLSLGVICGAEFKVVRVAPLGCPMQIEIKGTALTLRKEEANQLIVEQL